MTLIEAFLKNKSREPLKPKGHARADSNIALIKYWGKRDTQLNLPATNSLSINLDGKGTETTLTPLNATEDRIVVNGKLIDNKSDFAKRLIQFIDLFRAPTHRLDIQTENNIPTAAGLASSASGFAALTLALNDLYDWQLDKKTLSLFARLGSGSACRSIYTGFVEWQKGEKADGSDSYAVPLKTDWPELQIGLIVLSSKIKSISSREAMLRTVKTSPAYKAWPSTVSDNLTTLKKALSNKDFHLLGQTAENNAIAMHETMHQATPTINYDLPETKTIKQKIQQRRKEGLPVYFTQDAGPNIKLIYLKSDEMITKKAFQLAAFT